MLLCPWGFSRQEYWSGLPFSPAGLIKQVQIKITLGLAITYKAALNTLTGLFWTDAFITLGYISNNRIAIAGLHGVHV